MSRKTGFTLIELLVVIAIIAILAAILFPVFTQAKNAAKKATDMSNLKQMATAVKMYAGDNDDVLPLGHTAIPGDSAGWSWDYWQEIPAGWDPSIGATGAAANQNFWANSIYSYVKSWAVYTSPGASEIRPSFANNPPAGVTVGSSTYTYNGLLTAFSDSAVAAPSSLPMFWAGRGARITKGYAYTNPYLRCPNADAPCTYQPATPSCSNAVNGQQSTTARTTAGGTTVPGVMFSGGQNFVMTDASAKFRRLGANAGNATDPKNDPWTLYNSGGVPGGSWYGGGGATGCHAYLFRPDFDFATWDQAVTF